MKYYWLYEYPVGPVGIAEEDGRIVYVFFADKSDKGVPNNYDERETPLIRKAAGQLGEYFAGSRKEFDLPLEFKGTVFQKKVWAALMNIPYGETRSYSGIARECGNPKATRAVGMANNRNPIVIICPCHRVVGKDGSLTGYGGGLDNKEYLLKLECKK